MIFEPDVNFITSLNSTTLVELMRRLMYIECTKTGIPLRSSSVALQITVPDGGEDGRVEWTGGAESTNYFPSRFSIFQSKAQNLDRNAVRNEVFKPQPSDKTGNHSADSTLKRAIVDVLERQGSYVIFCSKAFTNEKKDGLRSWIREAINEGGGDASRLAAVEIYDANQIAAWAQTHPAVAAWLASLQTGRSLEGLQPLEAWARSPEMTSGEWIDVGKPRFAAPDEPIPVSDRKDPELPAWTFEQAADRVMDHLAEPGAIMRVSGPSGYGKTRFVHETLKKAVTSQHFLTPNSIVYADYPVTGDEVLKVCLLLADSQSYTILVVDQCPALIHQKLAEFTQRQHSELRLITIDVEGRAAKGRNTLHIRLQRADDETVGLIASRVARDITERDRSFVQELAAGFPRVAVLAAREHENRRAAIASVDDILDRVLWGNQPADLDAERSLATLSLFNWVGFAGRLTEEASEVAECFLAISGELFVEQVLSFEDRGVVVRAGDYFQVAPVPIAVRLAARRLNLLPDGRLFDLFNRVTPNLQDSLLKRARWLDSSPAIRSFAEQLLAPNVLGKLSALNSARGAMIFDRLTHVVPDVAMDVLDRALGDLSVAQLKAFREGRSHIVWALERLVFRHQTFGPAATLLRLLGAAEVEEQISNNASGQFKQLFQLYLSGTEAPPADRLLVLDAGLASSVAGERELCIDALERMLQVHHFSRGGGAEEIGTSERLVDWQPGTYDEVWTFQRDAISRLTEFALSDDELAARARHHLGHNIRGLIGTPTFAEMRRTIKLVTENTGPWVDAIREINRWLYFDSKEAPDDVRREMRAYFDTLLPDDPVELALVYAHYHAIDFTDPDRLYDPDDRNENDYYYAHRRSQEIAEIVARNDALLDRALSVFVCTEAPSIYSFAARLAQRVSDRRRLFDDALAKLDDTPGNASAGFFAGLIAGIDSEDPAAARACILEALQAPKLKADPIRLIGSGRLQPEDLLLVVDLLRAGAVEPRHCVSLAYGRGLNHLTVNDVTPLLDALEESGAIGCWVALDLVSMWLHGGQALEGELILRLKRILTQSTLFEAVNSSTTDGYHFERSVEMLATIGAVDDRFAAALTRQVLGLCDAADSRVFFDMDTPAQKSLRTVALLRPETVWSVIDEAYATDDRLFSIRFEMLFKPDHQNQLAGGTLFGIPEAIYLNWVRNDPNARARFVVTWLPVVTDPKERPLQWHPAVETFISEFASADDVLSQLARRLTPTSWWGSLAPHLEIVLPLLEAWVRHPNCIVRKWASRQLASFRQGIAQAIKESEEDTVRFS